MASFATLANYADVYEVKNSLAPTDPDHDTKLSVQNGIGTISVLKRKNGENAGKNVAVHVGVNICCSDTSFSMSLWALPNPSTVSVTLDQGPPLIVRFSFIDSDVVDVKFTSGSGKIYAVVPANNNTVYDLSVGFSAVIIIPPP